MKRRHVQSMRPRQAPGASQPHLLLQQALEQHRRGAVQAAKQGYLAILRDHPDYFDALHLLGILEYQNGGATRAVELLRHALRVNPSLPAPYSNLGLALRDLGDEQAAQRSFESALELDPQHLETLNNLGNLLRDTQQFEAALAYFDRALQIKPAYISVLNNRANVLRDLHRLSEALAGYNAALELDPNYAQAYFNRGNVLQDLRQYEAAIRDYQHALRLKPEALEFWINLGNALQELQQYGAALESYNQALRLKQDSAIARVNQAKALLALHEPQAALLSYELALGLQADYIEAWLGRADALRELNRHHEALNCIEHALQLQPNLPAALNSRGVILGVLGQLKQAQADYRRAIALAPEKGMYYRNLVQAGALAADDPCFLAMQRLAAADSDMAPDDRVGLHFALGEALEKQGAHDASFAHYLRANALQRQRTRYPEQSTLGLLEWYKNTFTAQFLAERQGLGASSDAPIFVVGMPRSGSTLVEQILDSHPAVLGIGERRDIVQCIARCAAQHAAGRTELDTLAAITGPQLLQIGQEYVQRLENIVGAHPSHRKIIDKSLLNFIHIGLIHLALPQARFIHTRRSPVETCLSCFSKIFDDVPFSYDLGELGRYYRAYDALMAHWRAVLPPGVMLEVHYESLVDDFDRQARQLVQHCGLEWDDACAAFHQNQRAITTSSVAQVRQPLYRHAVERWHPPPELLQPLLDGLGPALAHA